MERGGHETETGGGAGGRGDGCLKQHRPRDGPSSREEGRQDGGCGQERGGTALPGGRFKDAGRSCTSRLWGGNARHRRLPGVVACRAPARGWNSISVTNVMPAAINTPFFTKVRTKLGVKPKGFPPIYQPGVVADAILYSAEKAPREIVAGGASKGLLLTQRVSPRLMDALMVRGGFGSQMTDEPKSTADPEALSRLWRGRIGKRAGR